MFFTQIWPIHRLWKNTTYAAFAVMAGATMFGAGIGSAQATILTFGCVSTDSCTFDELVNGATIQVNDKLFNDWILFDSDGDISPDFTNVTVSGLDDGGLDPGPGLSFSFNGELKVLTDSGHDFYNLIFGYAIDVLDPNFKIKDNTLTLVDYNISAATGDGGSVDIEEIAFDEFFDPLFNDVKFVVDDNLATCTSVLLCADYVGPGPEANPGFGEQLEDHRDFAPQTTVLVITDILLLTDFVPGNVVELNTFEQRFSQVPEPGTLALFGLGLAGLGFARRRKIM